MKTGILTLHSQMNYGGLLQAWALKNVVQELGHEVSVVDRWMSKGPVKGAVVGFDLIPWIKLFLKMLARGFSYFYIERRAFKTFSFIKDHLNLTDYHFNSWADLNGECLLDVLIVGSDQVWNGSVPSDVFPYVLYGAPMDFRAIAYAPSFGMTRAREFPAQRWPVRDSA